MRPTRCRRRRTGKENRNRFVVKNVYIDLVESRTKGRRNNIRNSHFVVDCVSTSQACKFSTSAIWLPLTASLLKQCAIACLRSTDLVHGIWFGSDDIHFASEFHFFPPINCVFPADAHTQHTQEQGAEHTKHTLIDFSP